MLQLSIAAACCTLLLISLTTADETEDARWSRQASSERERRIDDWVPVTDPCPTCKRPLVGEHRPGQSDDISSLLTPPSFGKPRNLPISNQDPFFSLSLPKGQNTIQFPPNNRPFSLRQTNSAPNFLQQNQPNPFIQEPKQQQFFSVQSQPHQNFGFQQSPFFIPPQQSHFPIANQPRPHFDFIQQQSVNSRPQPLPPQFNSRIPPKANTFPGIVTPVQIGALQDEKEEVQLLYVPVETLQKNKLKDLRPLGKQSSEKGPPFQISPTPQSIIKDQRFTPPSEQLNQREPKQNFNGVPPQFGNPSSFQFQQIGDTKFSTVFDQNFRHPGFQSFSQPQTPQQQQPPPPPSPSFIRNENQNRFDFTQQQPAIPSTQVRQSTQAFNQFVTQTPPSSFTNQIQYTTAPILPPNPPPNQPPLAVYMERNENSRVTDVLSILKEAKTIPVLDQVEDQSPIVFVGPSSLDPPKGYVKFDLPYLSSFENNRIERKIANLPFFVAPLNFKPPPGYSKIPFPAPHIGSVVISNSTVFKDALEKTSTTHKVAYSAFDFTTQKFFPEGTQVTLPSSPNFFEETRFNDISSTTPLPSTFKQFTSTPSFENTQLKFETARPHFDYQDPQFTRQPTTTETLTNFQPQNNQFTKAPPEIKPLFAENQVEYNVNAVQDDSQARKPQFVQQNIIEKQHFNTQSPFSQEQQSEIPQFSAGKPFFDGSQTQFSSGLSQFDGKQQFDVQTQEITTLPPSLSQFETQKPQFEREQATYQFDKDQFMLNNQNEGRPDFPNQREQDFTSQREQSFSPAKAPQFDSVNSFGANQPQFTNEQQAQTNFNQQYNNRDQIYNQQNSFLPQNNDFSTNSNIPTEEQSVVHQQKQNELTTEAVAQIESTTVYIPRRKTTPKQQYKSSTQQYKSSTPPPNYNPRRNRKPLYRGIPKNSGEIQTTTLASFTPDSNEQQVPVLTNSDINQSNQIGTRFEETLTNRYENKYEALNQNKEYQTASETYYQPEIENTVGPVFEQKSTESYTRTEKDETSTSYTQATPNYSNFQGINQFFNQVIQKENTYPTQEIITTPIEAPTTQAPFYTVQQETSPSTSYTESTIQTESASQQSVSINDQEYNKKHSYSEKRNRYRQKLQNTVNNYENTPAYDSSQKTESGDIGKPLRNKNKYRNRQRTGSRGQLRTSTSTETAVDENIPAHFSSIRGQHESSHNLANENTETQSTSTEQASTKIDVGKYGTFKRRRPVKAYERTTTSTESSSVEYETTVATVSSTRPYRSRTRTTSFPGERVTRHRARRPTTSTTPETSSVSDYTETTARAEENTNVDWGSYVSSFNPSAQGNDVLGSLEEQNKISKAEENGIDQHYTIQKSQSYEITSPNSIIDSSRSSGVTPSDQVSYSTNDQGSVSAFETRKFSSKKLLSGFVESDNTHHDAPAINSFDTHLDSGFQAQEERNLQTFEVEDKSALDKSTDGKKAYDPNTGKKIGGRRRGQWVRVRVKKPNQEYFETAESQNVANIGNSLQNPTKPSVVRLSSEEFSKLKAENKGEIKVENLLKDHVYFTTTTDVYSTTTEDSPSKFDLEKGVSAMIAEFMNVDEDESKDNAQEIFENVETKSTDKPFVQTVETSVEDEHTFEFPAVGNNGDYLKNTDASSDPYISSTAGNVKSEIEVTNAHEKDETTNTNENVNNLNVYSQQNVNQYHQIPDYQSTYLLNPVSSEMSLGAFQTQYHENYNEETEEGELQPKEREIKHTVDDNMNYEFSNHKYNTKDYVPEVPDIVEIQGNKKIEPIAKEEIINSTLIPALSTDKQVQESIKETASVPTDIPETTTSTTDLEELTEDYDVSITTDSSPLSATTQSKVLGTSTTTEISLETEICYKGRCIKSKKKRPQYQDLLKA